MMVMYLKMMSISKKHSSFSNRSIINSDFVQNIKDGEIKSVDDAPEESLKLKTF